MACAEVAPSSTTAHLCPTGSNTVAVVGGYLLVMGSQDSGNPGGPLHVFDISDPTSPIRVTSVADTDTDRHREVHALPLAVVSGRTYVAIPIQPQGVNFWELTEPTNPTFVGRISFSSRSGDYDNTVWQLSWGWPYLFASGTGDGVYVVDAADPSNPQLVSRIPTSRFGGARVGPVQAVGNLLLASNMAQDPSRLTVVNVADPRNAFQLATGTGPAKQYSTLVVGPQIFTVGNGGTFGFGTWSENKVQFTGRALFGSAKGGYCTLQDAHVFCGQSEQGMRKINVLDGVQPFEVANAVYARPEADHDFATVLGNLVFMGNDHGSGSALVPHQMEPDLSAPVPLGVYPNDNATQVGLRPRLTAFFSDAPAVESLTESSVFLREVSSCVVVEGGRSLSSLNAVTFSPTSALRANTSYELVFAAHGLSDIAGNVLENAYVMRFSTGTTLDNSRCDASEGGELGSSADGGDAGLDASFSTGPFATGALEPSDGGQNDVGPDLDASDTDPEVPDASLDISGTTATTYDSSTVLTDSEPDIRDAGHDTEDAGHDTEDAGHDTGDAGHDARDAGHDARDAGPELPPVSHNTSSTAPSASTTTNPPTTNTSASTPNTTSTGSWASSTAITEASTSTVVSTESSTSTVLGTGSSTSTMLSTGSSTSTASHTENTTLEPSIPLLEVSLDTLPALVGSPITYSAQFGGGRAPYSFQWHVEGCFDVNTSGDCVVDITTNTSFLERAFPSPGHYSVAVLVKDAEGRVAGASVVQTVYRAPTPIAPTRSTTILLDAARNAVWNVNQDANSVTASSLDLLDASTTEIEVGKNPRTIAQAPNGMIWVTNQGSDSITLIDPDQKSAVATIELPRASQPYGVAFDPNRGTAFVTLYASGTLVEIDPVYLEPLRQLSLGPTPAALAISAESKIYVTRFISPDAVGVVWEVDAEAMAHVRTIELPFDIGQDDGDPLTNEDPDWESGGRGVPNYLAQVTISPDGATAWVLGKKDNVARGPTRDGRSMTPDNFVRAIVCILDLRTGQEILSQRIDLDNRSLPVAAGFSPLGDYVYVLTQGSNFLGIHDAYNPSQHLGGTQDVGAAPSGLAVGPNNVVWVNGNLSRSVLAYDLAESTNHADHQIDGALTEVSVTEEPLDADVATGKRIFYDATDGRLSQHGYLACAACHYEGGNDGRTWDFTDRGEGLRNTPSLAGIGSRTKATYHWSGNFDELQDFEQEIRDTFGGLGFMSAADWDAQLSAGPFGTPASGLSPELDALSAYVTSLTSWARSPFRSGDGTLTQSAIEGKRIFEQSGCPGCHTGTNRSDFWPHDVGTILPSSGKRLHDELYGLVTPSLNGVWLTAPYLHDGRAQSLMDLLTLYNVGDGMGMTSHLSHEQLQQLVSYLEQLDGSPEAGTAASPATTDPPVPSTATTSSDAPTSNPATDTTISPSSLASTSNESHSTDSTAPGIPTTAAPAGPPDTDASASGEGELMDPDGGETVPRFPFLADQGAARPIGRMRSTGLRPGGYHALVPVTMVPFDGPDAQPLPDSEPDGSAAASEQPTDLAPSVGDVSLSKHASACNIRRGRTPAGLAWVAVVAYAMVRRKGRRSNGRVSVLQ
jgi:YVTN family beta-propeller protein